MTTFGIPTCSSVETDDDEWAMRWSEGKVEGGVSICKRGLGSIRGEWLALRVTLGKVADVAVVPETRRVRASGRLWPPSLTKSSSPHRSVGRESRKTPRIWSLWAGNIFGFSKTVLSLRRT